MRRLIPLVLLVAACAAPAVQQGAPASPGPIPAGASQLVAELPTTALDVYTDRPQHCPATSALIVFAGIERNAGAYRDNAQPLAERLCALVVSPYFDTQRFPPERYQRGGIVEDGAVLPPEKWTVSLIPALIQWVREKEGNPKLPVALIGHSAGAQFLGRVAAYVPTGATRIVIADPSTWVWPSLDRRAPYGLGGAFAPGEGDAALRRYLALPITVLVGGDDTGARNLVRNREANEQGPNRLGRAENAFHAAEQLARARNLPFGWRLIVAPGIAHNAKALFASDVAVSAFSP